MASKLFQGIGVLAILALVGGSIAALAVVGQRVHVTIAEGDDASSRGPDPIELLRADVAQIATDLAALGEGHGTQLQSLHEALESAAADRANTQSASFRALEAQLDALRARI